MGGSVITGTDATVAQYCSYIRGLPTEDWALSNRPAVWINVLEYPPVLVKCSNDTDTALIVLRCVWLYKFLADRIEMSSNRLTPVATRPQTIEEVPSNSSASFFKRVSESNLDKLYDLPEGIQDVMGLQALRLSAAVCKVMTLFTFLKESDSESIRRSHRCRAKEIAVSMSKQTSVNKNAPTDTTLSRRSVQRTVVSKITGRDAGLSLIPTAGGRPRSSASSMYRRSMEEDTVQALMDLSLPRFTKLGDGVLPKTEPWPVTEKSSPLSARDGNRARTPSPCYQLDDISSASSVGDTSTNDYKLTLSYDTEDSITPVGSIEFPFGGGCTVKFRPGGQM